MDSDVRDHYQKTGCTRVSCTRDHGQIHVHEWRHPFTEGYHGNIRVCECGEVGWLVQSDVPAS